MIEETDYFAWLIAQIIAATRFFRKPCNKTLAYYSDYPDTIIDLCSQHNVDGILSAFTMTASHDISADQKSLLIAVIRQCCGSE